jgi:dienelactone hydrolase
MRRIVRRTEHDPEKWKPVVRKIMLKQEAKAGRRFEEKSSRFSHIFGMLTVVAAARLAFLACAVMVALPMPLHAAPLPGPEGPEQGQFRHQLWLVPSTIPDVAMRTVVLRPQGPGPFPLAVINHGTVANEDLRAALPQAEFTAVATWFVRHGYVVALPQRPGHGETGGTYLEGIRSCDNADFERAGLGAAASIQAAVDYLTGEPFVRKDGVVLVGHSAGGWGALAAASREPRAVRAVINFAGGLGGRSYGKPNRNCAPERLIEAAGIFGRTIRIPTLWLYAANDTYFGPALSKSMADAFQDAGGPVEYHLLPAFGQDGHALMAAPAAVPIWAPIVARFLQLAP